MTFAVVFDLEFTAWSGSLQNRWLRPGEFREVVQIGAVKIDVVRVSETGSFEALVKPRFNPVLSDYFEELTGVINARVAAKGTDFSEAYRAFIAFGDGAPLFSFGRDDLVLEENLKLYGLAGNAPALPRCVNVVPWLISHGVDPRGLHACDVAGAAGASFEGRRHDALDDARSVAAGIAALVARGASNPFAMQESVPCPTPLMR